MVRMNFGKRHRAESKALLLAAAVFLAAEAGASTNRLVVSSGSGWPGTTGNVVSIALRNETPVRGLQLELADLPDYLQPDSVWVASRAYGFIAQFNDVAGALHLIAIGFTFTLDADSGAVVQISYRVAPEAPLGAAVELKLNQVKVIDPQSQLLEVSIQNGVFLVGSSSEVQDQTAPPASFALLPNYPNPLRSAQGGTGSTVIGFSLPRPEATSLVIYDLLGREVRTLLRARIGAGWHQVSWDGTDELGMPVPAGVYLYRLRAGNQASTRRLSVVR